MITKGCALKDASPIPTISLVISRGFNTTGRWSLSKAEKIRTHLCKNWDVSLRHYLALALRKMNDPARLMLRTVASR